MKEAAVESHLIRSAAAHGGLALKWVSPGNAGVPDRLVFMPGGHLALVELKRPGAAPRPLQVAWAERLGDLGFDVSWMDSKAGVDRWLAERIERWKRT